MLSGFEVKNFKRIGKFGVRLDNLTRVNFLVGENGSGKASILDWIHETYNGKSVLIKDSLTSVETLDLVDFKSTCDIDNNSNRWKAVFVDLAKNDNTIILDLLGYALSISQTNIGWNIIDEDILEQTFWILEKFKIKKKNQKIERDILPQYHESEQLNGGVSKIINLIYGILLSHKINKSEMVLLNEPCNHLHPNWQKILPKVFNYLAKKLDIQFYIATHSPFIVSATGDLTDSIPGFPDQKVYFLKEGRNACKRGNISAKGRDGYWGRKVTQITSKMLGAGLMDLVSAQAAVISPDSPIFVLCEGEGEDEDARIYNIIFDKRKPPVLFVSCRGSSQVHRTFQILREIKPGLSADFEMLMVRDRDHEFPKLQDIKEYEEINEGCKILRRRAIETYLFNTETAELLLRKFNKKLGTKGRKKIQIIEREVQRETERGIPGNSYKKKLEEVFTSVTFGLASKYLENSNYNLKEKLAKLINQGTKIYKELEKNIFG